MIVIGAKGFAIEVAETYLEKYPNEDVSFFDDRNTFDSNLLFNKYHLITSFESLQQLLNKENALYTLGIGNPKIRFDFYNRLINTNAAFTSVISTKAQISNIDCNIDEGCIVLAGAVVSNQVNIAKGTMIYNNAVITHNCTIGKFVEISPAAVLLGNCIIGDLTHIGANATILPHVKIGKNVVVGAGAVVCENIPDNTVVVGVPAKFLKNNPL